ncbi:hypothetical protein [Neobacillus niacini]|uniref:hypothetical protein n=1 Tax=Neobacillus niacini TaxID=86668 RepID=UPI001EE71ED9|nr:hypothetical protein [Neobacillus niacini]
MHLTPGDRASVMLGEEATKQQIEELRQKLGLNLPLTNSIFIVLAVSFKGIWDFPSL